MYPCIWSCFIFMALIAVGSADSSYRYDYTFDKEAGGWLKLHLVPATFNEAFLRCKFEGAVLASPLDENIQKAMVKLQNDFDVGCGIYTGIHATISKGDFTSIDGVPLAKIPVTWAPDEPDNFKNEENCIIMLRNGTVADTRCNDTFPYVCYRKKMTTPTMITACGTVDPGYQLDPRTGSCYKFHHVGQTWRRAQMTCLAEGGHLAIINSGTEATVLKELFAKRPDDSLSLVTSSHRHITYLGFFDWDKNRSWFTVNGQTLEEAGYISWSADEPTNSQAYEGGQYCGAMFRTGLLIDHWCEVVQLSFICEKTPESLLDNNV